MAYEFLHIRSLVDFLMSYPLSSFQIVFSHTLSKIVSCYFLHLCPVLFFSCTYYWRGSVVKNLSSMQETPVSSLGREDPLEKEKATHSSILGWRIPWTGEPGGLQSTGLQRVGHDWATNTRRPGISVTEPLAGHQGVQPSQQLLVTYCHLGLSPSCDSPQHLSCSFCSF